MLRVRIWRRSGWENPPFADSWMLSREKRKEKEAAFLIRYKL